MNEFLSSPRGTLTILPSLTGEKRGGGKIAVTKKLLTGVGAYAKYWPGRVQVLMEEGTGSNQQLDCIEVRPQDLPYSLDLVRFDAASLDPLLYETRVALLGAHYRQTGLGNVIGPMGIPYVYTTEYSLRTRMQILGTQHLNPLLHARRAFWEWQEERRQRDVFRHAAGIQCNGVPTYNAYRTVNANCLLYFDTRIEDSMLVDPRTLEHRLDRLGTRPFRLAFSGRLVAMKGADHLIHVAAALRDMAVPFEFFIFGAGEMEAEMRAAVIAGGLRNHVFFRGNLDFGTELVPYMREEIDLFVCCHRQGDPSCTYLETMACGVPIVGYDNEAFVGITDSSHSGWTTPMNDPHLLAKKISALVRDPESIRTHSRRARVFAGRHTLDRTFATRVAHLESLALPMVLPSAIFAGTVAV